ncbi:hypothetical protein EW146_g8841, partial [Bondarzewia mesenterica]
MEVNRINWFPFLRQLDVLWLVIPYHHVLLPCSSPFSSRSHAPCLLTLSSVFLLLFIPPSLVLRSPFQMDVHPQSSYNMSQGELQYSSSQQQQPPQQSAWPSGPHLLQPSQPFSSPSTPSTSLGEQQHYSNYYQHTSSQSSMNEGMLDRASTLSLNLSSLSVASPTNLSPINPSPHTSTATSGVSPVTPISPSPNQTLNHNPFGSHHPQFPIQNQFSFTPPDLGIRYDDQHYDLTARRVALSSRSSSSSDKSVPRKRSFTAGTSLSTNVEEGMYDTSTGMDLSTPASYDEVEMGYPSLDHGGSPIDGGSSSGEQDDQLKPLDSQRPSSSSQSHGMQAGGMNIIGKPLGTNNFVTKLYQMINDPKSAHFIAWTELGTSFVVSNVGEFSRSILGSHFKHNNFSSFVRQLNMYGFHKINRVSTPPHPRGNALTRDLAVMQTPRAQRTSTDAQTWEFSHHKFLRGRPDLLEEIKRKALEPDPSIKHRVELPGEVAAQLAQMRDENRRVVNTLTAERAKFERLALITKTLYDVVAKSFPGGGRSFFPSFDPFFHPRTLCLVSYDATRHAVAPRFPRDFCRLLISRWLTSSTPKLTSRHSFTVPVPFPADLIESSDSPNIYITSPTMTVPSHAFPPPSMQSLSNPSLHSLSPGSSPTAPDFPAHVHSHTHPHSHSHTPHTLSRQHSFQHPY